MRHLFKGCPVVLLVITIVALLPDQAPAAARYVAAAGGVAGGAGDIEHPWTLAYANSQLSGGDTAFLRAGTYTTAIQPINSGSEGSWITYQNYPGETVTITVLGGSGATIARNFIRISGTDNTRRIRFIDCARYGASIGHRSGGNPCCHHVLMEYCYFDSNRGRSNILAEGADYVTIANCELRYQCRRTAASPCRKRCGAPILDQFDMLDCHYFWIRDNMIYECAHTNLNIRAKLRGTKLYGLIEGNMISNKYHHALGMLEDLRGGFASVQHVVIQNNAITDTGCDHRRNFCGTAQDRENVDYNHNAFQASGADYIIIRNNVVKNCGKTVVGCPAGLTVERVYQYNNTFYDVVRWLNVYGKGTWSQNVCKNNVIANSVELDLYGEYAGASGSFVNNCWYGGPHRWQWRGITYHSLTAVNGLTGFSGNISANPMFVNPPADLTIGSTSACIDGGAALTKARNSGKNSAILVVADPYYFFDGYGITEGDTIEFHGSNNTAMISEINYAASTITLSAPATWTSGEGVSLSFEGKAPDIGGERSGAAPELPKTLPKLTGTAVALRGPLSNPEF